MQTLYSIKTNTKKIYSIIRKNKKKSHPFPEHTMKVCTIMDHHYPLFVTFLLTLNGVFT